MTLPYLADIHGQPRSLAAVLDAGVPAEAKALLARLADFDRVVLTGMGSSLHGQHPTFLRLVGRGTPVWNVETAELLGEARGLLQPRTLLWITSQSGASAEAVALLAELPRPRPTVLASTSDLHSPLAAAADAVIDLNAAGEATVSTRSYVNTLAAHALALGAALGEQPDGGLLEAPNGLAGYLQDWDAHVDQIDEQLTAPTLFVVGRGTSLAAVNTGALIIKEAARTAVEGMSTPQFRHGPLELADETVGVVALAGSGSDVHANQRLVDDLRAAGATVVVAGQNESGAGKMPAVTSVQALPLAEILPLQALSVALARRRGIEPGMFTRIAKVTTTL